MKISLFVLAFFVFVLPFSANAQTFGAQEFTLKNGMQVVVIPNHRAPVITHMIWMKVGGADNTPGLSGMAHYFEHLMFKGTKTMAPGDFSKTIKMLGGDDNAFTGQDYTAYFESIAVENLPKVMAMEADRLQNLNPPEDHYKSEKSVVLEERRQRTENDIKSVFAEQLNGLLFINHPYNTPVVGWMDEIEKYEWADVKAYYDAWYAPNNAILVVSGDITAEKLKPLAEKYYGSIPTKKLPPRLRPKIPPMPGNARLNLEDQKINQPMFERIYIAPTEAKDRKDSLSLQVLADILDAGPSSRFYKHLVVEKKTAVEVSFDYNANMLDYGIMAISAIPSDQYTAEDVERAIDDELNDVLQNGVSEQEVKDSIQRLQDQGVFARDSVAGPAMIFGQALSTGSTIRDVEYWTEDIAKITAKDVHAAALKYLNPAKPWIRPPVSGYLLPAKEQAGEKPAEDQQPKIKKE